MEWPLQAKRCPAWIDANQDAKGYYRADYQGALLSALTGGDVEHRLSAAERADLIGNAEAMANGGRMPAADALRLAETFHSDSSRQVFGSSLALALSVQRDVVPENLQPSYQRFLRKNFQARARELGWIPRPGESEDVRLLRPQLVGAMARQGGDQELAGQARQLAEKWLADRKAVAPDVVEAVLSSAAWYGALPLFQRFLTEFEKTKDRQDQQRLLGAMTDFRDPASIEAGMQEVLSGRVKLADGFLLLLFGGRNSPATLTMPFEFVKAHFDRIMQGNPSIFGDSFGSFLPNVGRSFCDPQLRQQLQDYFDPLVGKYDGAPRNLAQTLETVDLCIARVAAQRPSVSEFLSKY